MDQPHASFELHRALSNHLRTTFDGTTKLQLSLPAWIFVRRETALGIVQTTVYGVEDFPVLVETPHLFYSGAT